MRADNFHIRFTAFQCASIYSFRAFEKCLLERVGGNLINLGAFKVTYMSILRNCQRKARMGRIACFTLVLLSGCESTSERLLAEGYPAPFAYGFDDGCVSGRQAAGALGEFRKNVAVYLRNPQYATGWDDGFRQCQASAVSDIERHLRPESQADRDWKHSKDQAWGSALKGR